MKREKKVFLFIVIFFIALIGGRNVQARDFYKSYQRLIITDSVEIINNTNIRKYCEEQGFKFQYMYSLEQSKEIINRIENENIKEIIYITWGNNCRFMNIADDIDENVNIDKYEIFDYDYLENILEKFKDKKDEKDEEKIKLNVINKGETEAYWIYKSPNRNSRKVGYVYGKLAEVKILEEVDGFYKVDFMRYDTKERMEGFVPKGDIIERTIDSEFKVIVSIDDQMVRVYHHGELIKEIQCSTGLGGNYTPKGRFIIGNRGPSFGDRYTYTCYNWVRFNYNYLFHSVLYNKDGSVNRKEFAKLGKPASHGCIRMPLEDSKWFYETITEGSLVEIK